MGMLPTLFEDEKFYPLKRFGKTIPGYYATRSGKIYMGGYAGWSLLGNRSTYSTHAFVCPIGLD